MDLKGLLQEENALRKAISSISVEAWKLIALDYWYLHTKAIPAYEEGGLSFLNSLWQSSDVVDHSAKYRKSGLQQRYSFSWRRSSDFLTLRDVDKPLQRSSQKPRCHIEHEIIALVRYIYQNPSTLPMKEGLIETLLFGFHALDATMARLLKNANEDVLFDYFLAVKRQGALSRDIDAIQQQLSQTSSEESFHLMISSLTRRIVKPNWRRIRLGIIAYEQRRKAVELLLRALFGNRFNVTREGTDILLSYIQNEAFDDRQERGIAVVNGFYIRRLLRDSRHLSEKFDISPDDVPLEPIVVALVELNETAPDFAVTQYLKLVKEYPEFLDSVPEDSSEMIFEQLVLLDSVDFSEEVKANAAKYINQSLDGLRQYHIKISGIDDFYKSVQAAMEDRKADLLFGALKKWIVANLKNDVWYHFNMLLDKHAKKCPNRLPIRKSSFEFLTVPIEECGCFFDFVQSTALEYGRKFDAIVKSNFPSAFDKIKELKPDVYVRDFIISQVYPLMVEYHSRSAKSFPSGKITYASRGYLRLLDEIRQFFHPELGKIHFHEAWTTCCVHLARLVQSTKSSAIGNDEYFPELVRIVQYLNISEAQVLAWKSLLFIKEQGECIFWFTQLEAAIVYLNQAASHK